MWSTTASTVSTVAVLNDKYPVDKAKKKKTCSSKSLYYPIDKLSESWYRKIINDSFYGLKEEENTIIAQCGLVDDSQLKKCTLHRTNNCQRLELYTLDQKLISGKMENWLKLPCFKTNYYNYPKLVFEMSGHIEMNASEILQLVIGKSQNFNY